MADVTSQLHGNPGIAQTSVDQTVVETERLLHRGEPLLAYNTAQTGLEHWPEHVRLAQL